MDAGRSILRWTVGPLFVGHGTQKLFGWFGGNGLEGTGGYFEGLGMRPGRSHALAAGAAETAGGAMLTLGFLTPVAAALLSAVQVTAIRKVHGKNGIWITGGGLEYNAVLIGALAALVEQGPGHPSVDATLMPRVKGPALAVAALGVGAAGSFLGDRLFGGGASRSGWEQQDASCGGEADGQGQGTTGAGSRAHQPDWPHPGAAGPGADAAPQATAEGDQAAGANRAAQAPE